MALSLECGDCKVQLRSVEEAQEHAELTGHANFQESTEAVIYNTLRHSISFVILSVLPLLSSAIDSTALRRDCETCVALS